MAVGCCEAMKEDFERWGGVQRTGNVGVNVFRGRSLTFFYINDTVPTKGRGTLAVKPVASRKGSHMILSSILKRKTAGYMVAKCMVAGKATSFWTDSMR